MNHKIKPLLSLTLLAVALGGCSNTPVVIHTGDRVELDFTCRLPNGELAATTRPDSAVDEDRKSPFYLPRTGPETVTISASVMPDFTKRDRVSFEDEIMTRLGGSLGGLREGDQIVRELQAERYPITSPKNKIVRMALVRKRQKEMRMTKEEYTKRVGKSPEPGQSFVIDPLVPGRVSEVNDKEVVILFAPEQGKPLMSPFGSITARENDSHYELVINAEKDRLVRIGGLVGRINKVDGDSFEIDYGHPFGGEKLRCDMNIVSVFPPAKIDGGLRFPQADKTEGNVQDTAHVSVDKNVVAPQPTPIGSSGGELDPEAKKFFDSAITRAQSLPDQTLVTPDAARPGDLVLTNYTVTLEDGSLLATTLGTVAGDPAVKKVAWYHEPTAYTPVDLVAGKQEVMPGLGEALIGMKAGEKQRITLTADKAFGMPDPRKIQTLPCSQALPVIIRMPADEYVKRFSVFPLLNKEVELLPYFKSRVTEVTERDVALTFQVADGASFQDSFGAVDVAVAGGKITITMKPRIGAPFQIKDANGIIIAADGTSFTVDFNHPLAGKTIVLDLETVSVATSAQGVSIGWVDDHDAGLVRAKQEGKPVFLILYADWCGWCKKSFDETILDPRIMALKDRFVWVRVNSDKEQKYKKQYGQEGFPMIVLLNPEGAVMKQIDGYRDARALREEIKAVLN